MTTIHTRSRHLDVDYSAVRLDRSPLKDARHAIRSSNMPDNEPSVCIDPHPSFEDEILLSPKKGIGSSSKKRALESDAEDEENRLQGTQDQSHPVSQPSKQTKRSKRSKAAPSSSTLPALFARQRQKSASSTIVPEPSSSKAHPPDATLRVNAGAVPLLDLTLVPPSPRKATLSGPAIPSKSVGLSNGGNIVEMASSLDAEVEVSSTSDEEKASVSPPPPPSSSPPPTVDHDESEEMGLDSQPVLLDDQATSVETMEVELSHAEHALSEKMPPPPLPARFSQQQLRTPVSQMRTWKPGHQHSVSSSFPMSPLTPLPPTPAVGLKRKVADTPTISTTAETTVAEQSRRKSLAPAPRMTRAATLRQQKVQQQRLTLDPTPSVKPTPRNDTDAGELHVDNEASNSRGRSTTRTLTSSTAASRARSITRADLEAGKSRRSTTCPPTEPPEKRPPSLPSFTFTSKVSQTPPKQPESVSTSPRKTFKLTLPSSLGGPSALNLSPKKGVAKPGGETALSALSRALAKLAVPPPPKPNMQNRPSTSLGFSREISAHPTSRSLGQMPPPPPPPSAQLGSGGNKGKGKEKATTSSSNPLMRPGPFASSTARPPTFGGGSSSSRLSHGGNPFSRPLQKLQHARLKASKVTSLETVQGSPLKAGSSSLNVLNDTDDEIHAVVDEDGDSSSSRQATSSSSSDPIQNADEASQGTTTDAHKPTTAGSSSSDPAENASADISQTEKEMKQISKLNASRRASMAFSALERSMREQGVGLGHPSPSGTSNSADKSNTSMASPKDPSINFSGGKQRSTSATITTSSGRTVRPPAQFRSFTAAVSSTPPSSNALGRTRSHPTILVGSSMSSDNEAESSARSPFDFDFDDRSSDAESGGAGHGPRKRPKKMPGSLCILDGCTIFVDVRTEEGDDASALFVDMLQGLGAKILTRGVGQTCTHVVYKNGLASTISKVRLMDAESRPRVVGIGWVVECAEKRELADESKFAVELEGLHVAGASKRRKSVMPQPMAITSGPMDAFMEFSRLNKNGDSSGSARDNSVVILDDSMEEDANTSTEGGRKVPKLTPLEVARRRGTMASRPT